MTDEEKKELYPRITHLWHAAKTGDNQARFALEVADLILNTDCTENGWSSFADRAVAVHDRCVQARAQDHILALLVQAVADIRDGCVKEKEDH